MVLVEAADTPMIIVLLSISRYAGTRGRVREGRVIHIAQRLKSRLEIAQSAYLSVEDIRKLLEVGYTQARKIYGFASEVDDQALGKWRVQDRKVRMESVMLVTGKKIETILRQIKNG
jgi:hypothetical protein